VLGVNLNNLWGGGGGGSNFLLLTYISHSHLYLAIGTKG